MEALKFVERLRELGSGNVYEAIIEEGCEEAVMNGEEEVKFLKKDIKQCTEKEHIKYMQDIIKFTITGNQQKLQKLIEEHALSASDLYDTRGFAVKAYDPEKTIINTREWNPFHFAIYFR